MPRQNANAQVTNFVSLRQPMHGSVDGHPVRCIAYGDVQGNSPSYLTVDNRGQSTWQSLADVQITDTNFLPITQEAFQNSGKSAQFTGSGSSR